MNYANNSWHKFLIPCEPRHAVLLEGMLKEAGVAVVLQDLPNAHSRYASHGIQLRYHSREFFIREDGVTQAREIIKDFLLQYEIPQDYCQEIIPSDQRMSNSVEDQMVKQRFYGLLFKIGISAVVVVAMVWFLFNGINSVR